LVRVASRLFYQWLDLGVFQPDGLGGVVETGRLAPYRYDLGEG
jgi:hypothetical protein